ncbi:MAG: AAA family ATPase [Desulfamplus sp.]|nr:AAA family ATPase [Desulfamplus sp.]
MQWNRKQNMCAANQAELASGKCPMVNKDPVKIVAVIGPKGGVGKTSISANLAISLSRLGRKVVAVDLDLGASNLNTFLGIRKSKYTLDDFVLNKVDKLHEIVLETGIKDMGFICGGNIPGIANLHYSKKMKLIRNLSMLEHDFVLLDLGAGASYNVVDFVIISRQNLLVTTPEIPSILNTYSFLKTLVFRRLAMALKALDNKAILDLVERARDVDKNPHLKKMGDLVRTLGRIDERASDLAVEVLAGIRPTLVLNRIRSDRDENACAAIENLMKQYLGIEARRILHVHEDAAVGHAIAKMRPVMIERPDSVFAKDINEIALFLTQDT